MLQVGKGDLKHASPCSIEVMPTCDSHRLDCSSAAAAAAAVDCAAGAGLSSEQLLTFSNAKSEFWLYLIEMLAKLAEHPDLQVGVAVGGIALLQRGQPDMTWS
jgi:hypothetical protein